MAASEPPAPTLQTLTILGSTGSIGRSTLDVVARHPRRFRVHALVAQRSVDVMLAQCAQFRPALAVLEQPEAAAELARRVAASGLPVAVGFGIKTPERAAAIARVADAAVVGTALVEEVQTGLAMNESVKARVLSKVESLAKAVRSARVDSQTV